MRNQSPPHYGGSVKMRPVLIVFFDVALFVELSPRSVTNMKNMNYICDDRE